MKSAEALRKARALLVEHGWEQGEYEVPTSGGGCGYCAMGAIFRACYEDGDPYDWGAGWRHRKATRALWYLRRAVLESDDVEKGWDMDIARWNDQPIRSFADVLAAFDRAIALAEQEAGS